MYILTIGYKELAIQSTGFLHIIKLKRAPQNCHPPSHRCCSLKCSICQPACEGYCGRLSIDPAPQH